MKEKIKRFNTGVKPIESELIKFRATSNMSLTKVLDLIIKKCNADKKYLRSLELEAIRK